MYLINHCPNTRTIQLKYLPNDADMKEWSHSTSIKLLDETDKAIIHNAHDRVSFSEEQFPMKADENNASSSKDKLP